MGRFIVFEGIDGSGKTTIVKLVADKLIENGYSVVLTAEPTNGPIGKIIKEYLTNAENRDIVYEALLFAADRHWHNENIIKPGLEKVDFVISDRYVFSSYAYQSNKGISSDWLQLINRHILNPDYIFLINISPDLGLSRLIESGRSLKITEKRDVLNHVHMKYLEMANKYNFIILDGSKKPNTLVDEIISILLG